MKKLLLKSMLLLCALIVGSSSVWATDPVTLVSGSGTSGYAIPTGWTSKANTATVEKSTDVHGGTASVLVKGDEKYNQRFASQELSLKAGTYVFSYYAKATTADVAQARAGWVPYKDGAPVSSSYKYGNFVSINTTEWTLVSIEFTLNEDSTISVICMNPKVTEGKTSGKDILVDDATLIKK